MRINNTASAKIVFNKKHSKVLPVLICVGMRWCCTLLRSCRCSRPEPTRKVSELFIVNVIDIFLYAAVCSELYLWNGWYLYRTLLFSVLKHVRCTVTYRVRGCRSRSRSGNFLAGWSDQDPEKTFRLICDLCTQQSVQFRKFCHFCSYEVIYAYAWWITNKCTVTF